MSMKQKSHNLLKLLLSSFHSLCSSSLTLSIVWSQHWNVLSSNVNITFHQLHNAIELLVDLEIFEYPRKNDTFDEYQLNWSLISRKMSAENYMVRLIWRHVWLNHFFMVLLFHAAKCVSFSKRVMFFIPSILVQSILGFVSIDHRSSTRLFHIYTFKCGSNGLKHIFFLPRLEEFMYASWRSGSF